MTGSTGNEAMIEFNYVSGCFTHEVPTMVEAYFLPWQSPVIMNGCQLAALHHDSLPALSQSGEPGRTERHSSVSLGHPKPRTLKTRGNAKSGEIE